MALFMEGQSSMAISFLPQVAIFSYPIKMGFFLTQGLLKRYRKYIFFKPHLSTCLAVVKTGIGHPADSVPFL